MEIPWKQLSPDALEALLEDIASRDGTDYGARELGLSEKCAQLRCALEEGRALLMWNGDLESASIVEKQR